MLKHLFSKDPPGEEKRTQKKQHTTESVKTCHIFVLCLILKMPWMISPNSKINHSEQQNNICPAYL